MKVLVTGVKGQLGFDVVNELEKRGHTAIGVDVDTMDITNPEQVESVIKANMPEAVIHCAAYTAVDLAEDNKELCDKINGEGTENIAKVCKEINAKLMYISTDYVFNGEGYDFFEPEDKITTQMNVYGRTKYEGELAVQKYIDKFFIIRISWVFGINGNNFVKTMIKLGQERKSINVINDQIGSPTYTYDLAKLIKVMIKSDKYGIYHATNEGVCSWYEFALEIFKKLNIKIDVNPVSSDEYNSVAKRPKNSRLSKEKLIKSGFEKLPTWQDAIERYLEELSYL